MALFQFNFNIYHILDNLLPCTGESKHDINRLEYLMVVPPKKEHNYDQECPKTELAMHKWLTVTHLLNAFKEDGLLEFLSMKDMYKFIFSSIGQMESPLCPQCRTPETVSHYLLHCRRFIHCRNKLFCTHIQ